MKLKISYVLAATIFQLNLFAEEPFDLLITDVNVIDMCSGNIRMNTNLGIVDKHISYIGNENLKSNKKLVASGKWVIPGLWDMHVHISHPSFFPMFIENGIVGVRDMGG